jgi:hypothetical protein
MKTISTLFLVLASLSAGLAHADVALSDNTSILGKWRVTAEAAALDKTKKALNVTWDFQKDGTLLTIGEDSLHRTRELEIPIKYSVENGVIKKQITPGRDKYEECAVVDMDAKNMTLKCKYLYLFLTRK